MINQHMAHISMAYKRYNRSMYRHFNLLVENILEIVYNYTLFIYQGIIYLNDFSETTQN